MQTLNIKGHTVEIYDGYFGDQIFIYKADEKVYSARVNKGQGEARAKQIIG